MDTNITPIFVVGSPRSGTSLAAAYLCTSRAVADFGELGVFAFTRRVARREFERVQSPLKDVYLAELDQHAIDFVLREARATGARYFCDSTPWNLHVIDYLREIFPHALFILTIRHYAGVIQSLERSYHDGWKWAGPSATDRALIWSRAYKKVTGLPMDRTITLGYDRLCQNPSVAISDFIDRLALAGFPVSELCLSAFAESHATTSPRRTVAVRTSGGPVTLHSMQSFDPECWRVEDEQQVRPIVADCEHVLRALFPTDYSVPEAWKFSSRGAEGDSLIAQ